MRRCSKAGWFKEKKRRYVVISFLKLFITSSITSIYKAYTKKNGKTALQVIKKMVILVTTAVNSNNPGVGGCILEEVDRGYVQEAKVPKPNNE